jgi:hypothetical protein
MAYECGESLEQQLLHLVDNLYNIECADLLQTLSQLLLHVFTQVLCK